jgi:hypothetical protein
MQKKYFFQKNLNTKNYFFEKMTLGKTVKINIGIFWTKRFS